MHVAAALIVDATGRYLLVRKRGTTAFMQAGGKIEPGESPHDALVREVAEELGVHVTADQVRPSGTTTHPPPTNPVTASPPTCSRSTAWSTPCRPPRSPKPSGSTSSRPPGFRWPRSPRRCSACTPRPPAPGATLDA
ncbi:NUDIX hydrolase [Cellulomonas soli]